MRSRRLRVVLAPFGTRGDVVPLIALAHELRKRGHDPRFVAPADSAALIRAHGFGVEATTRPFSAFLHESQNEIKVLAAVFREVGEQFDALLSVAENADAFVGSMLQLAAPSVAEATGRPYFYAMFSPTYLETTTIPIPVPVGRTKITISSPLLIRLLFFLRNALTPLMARALMKQRARLGLEPIRSIFNYLARSGDLLYGFDPELTPVPSDVDFGHRTGHWPLENVTALDAEIESFLAEGDPPVYAGFGSMLHDRPEVTLATLATVLDELDLRAIASTAVRDVEISERILLIGDAPHEKLFPRTRLVIHHGGAGTLATAARAGVPQLVIPHLGDQFYHGNRVRELGLGPPPLDLDQLSVGTLEERLVEAARSDVREAAMDLGRRLRQRTGVTSAVEIIESRSGDRA